MTGTAISIFSEILFWRDATKCDESEKEKNYCTVAILAIYQQERNRVGKNILKIQEDCQIRIKKSREKS